MAPPPIHVLSEAEKNELLLAQHKMIERMAAQIAELESLVGKRRKPKSGKRPPREGKHRPLTETPDKTERVMASECGHCGTDVTGQVQQCRQRYDHVDLPPIRSIVTRVELWSGRCRCYGRRYEAQAPVGMASGSPFGPGIRAIMAYLHHSHHVGFERLSRIAGEQFKLTISEGAIANMFRRLRTSIDSATTVIRAKLLKARIIASDETTTRTNGVIQWQWVFLSSNAVLPKIASRRARSVAEDVLGQHRPGVWVSDRYSGQQELGREHQVCLAHVLRDVQYAIDSGDTAFAPHIRDHLCWAMKVGRRRDQLRDSTLAAYAAKADETLDRLVARPVAHPASRVLLK